MCFYAEGLTKRVFRRRLPETCVFATKASKKVFITPKSSKKWLFTPKKVSKNVCFEAEGVQKLVVFLRRRRPKKGGCFCDEVVKNKNKGVHFFCLSAQKHTLFCLLEDSNDTSSRCDWWKVDG